MIKNFFNMMLYLFFYVEMLLRLGIRVKVVMIMKVLYVIYFSSYRLNYV